MSYAEGKIRFMIYEHTVYGPNSHIVSVSVLKSYGAMLGSCISARINLMSLGIPSARLHLLTQAYWFAYVLS